jgi:glutaredoxin-related protein
MNTKTNNTGFLPILTAFTIFLMVVFYIVKSPVYAAEKSLTIHLFYSKTCPHCADEEVFLKKMELKYPQLEVKRYEITENKDDLKLFIEVGTRLGDRSARVPFLVIGNEYVLGYLSDETHGVEIEQKIINAFKNKPVDLVSQIISEIDRENTKTQSNQSEESIKSKGKFEINFPLIGKVDINSLTLPVLTVVIGLVDGFNPCAMWTLLFLISLLLGTKNRKKMWLLGGVFIATSGFVYFLFMAAWLNLFLIIGYVVAVRVAIGVTAAGIGGYYVWKYWKDSKTGCLVEGDEKRQETFKKLRRLTENNRILLAIGGIILLAVAVNLVELLCSAGFPAIYTKALTMTPMPTWQYYSYLLGYIFFYMLDDMIVFIIAMVTLEMVGVKQSYAKYSRLIGGILMLIIGILMLFKPEILMFN